MKKSGILNAELSRIVAGLGHGDVLVIGDAGLPVPAGVPCVDLAVTLGVPAMLDVLEAVLGEMCVEAAFRASEAGAVGGEIDARVACDLVPHEVFKERSGGAVVVVRTGEGTPYANVGLVSGVVF
ncbi:D-ribose pyranase [uncultured Tateyamaria sp.]|uniref:D-ribose pyranase n=1 Tax=uncultured Tateyamaria sp. TaxID=455651 RepID=UPI0026265E46|nr:D-ribose pyranase [uncultured Tateyamaria sp.]